MKIIRLLSLASLSLVAMSNSCDKQTDATPCSDVPAAVAAQPLALPLTCSLTALRGEAKTYVINSTIELAAAVQCGSATLPAVDFTQYTILAGRAPMTGGAVLRTQAVTKDCQGNYTYTVGIADGLTLSPTDVDHAVLVPKLASSATVNFVVTKTQ